MEFGATSHHASVPIGIMREHSKVFYHDSYSEGIRQFLLTFFFPLAITTVLTALVLLSKKTTAIIPLSRVGVISLWVLIFSLVLPVVLVRNPNVTFIPRATRYNWYPEATSAIEQVSDDVDNFYSTFFQRIRSIEEIRNNVSMYNDSTIKTTMDALIKQLGDAFEQPTTEAIKAQRSCGKTLQVIRRIHERIEADSKELGRLKEANDTIIALKELEHDFSTLDHTLASYLASQKQVLPVLMEHAANLRSLVQEGRLVELSQLLTYHDKAVLNISNQAYRVEVTLEYVYDAVDNDQVWGLKRSIISLNDKSVQEQLKAMIIGSFFGTTGTISGVLTVKGALAIATITLPAVAVPVGFAFTAAGCGIFAKSTFDAYQKESQYIKHLEALEIERGNMKALLDSIKSASEKRTRAIESSRGHINSLIGFLKDVPLLLDLGQGNLLLSQLNKLTGQYNYLNAIDSLFTMPPDSQDQITSTN